jgi:hypothetical protein
MWHEPFHLSPATNLERQNHAELEKISNPTEERLVVLPQPRRHVEQGEQQQDARHEHADAHLWLQFVVDSQEDITDKETAAVQEVHD